MDAAAAAAPTAANAAVGTPAVALSGRETRSNDAAAAELVLHGLADVKCLRYCEAQHIAMTDWHTILCRQPE